MNHSKDETEIEVIMTDTDNNSAEEEKPQDYNGNALEEGTSEIPTADAGPSDDGHPDSPNEAANCLEDESGKTNCVSPEKPSGSDPSVKELGAGEQSETVTISDNKPNDAEGIQLPYYLAFGTFGIILGIVVSYAIFSRLFHRRPYEIINDRNRLFGFISVAIVIAATVIFFSYFIPVWTRG